MGHHLVLVSNVNLIMDFRVGEIIHTVRAFEKIRQLTKKSLGELGLMFGFMDFSYNSIYPLVIQ